MEARRARTQAVGKTPTGRNSPSLAAPTSPILDHCRFRNRRLCSCLAPASLPCSCASGNAANNLFENETPERMLRRSSLSSNPLLLLRVLCHQLLELRL